MDEITVASWHGARGKLRWRYVLEPAASILVMSGVAYLVHLAAIHILGGHYGL